MRARRKQNKTQKDFFSSIFLSLRREERRKTDGEWKRVMRKIKERFVLKVTNGV